MECRNKQVLKSARNFMSFTSRLIAARQHLRGQFVNAMPPYSIAIIAILTATSISAAYEPPAIMREFRAAWIATVANIDWPSRAGLSTEDQQRELLEILDRAAELNLNAVVLQVRPSADALYASRLEPWSEYLTGEMGRAPQPFYDPLAFAVEAAHRRGIQLHAWFNPYRVRHADAKTPASPDHASQKTPELVRTYGKYLWFDPGEPAAVDQFIAVVLDVVNRYDIDGVHIDDYFYPYPINDSANNLVPFPDDSSYARARAAGETLARDDWRRQNVDRLIERMYREVKEAKPHVLVGISPFGIWRPGHPEGISGFDQYSSLYADARKWLREGWVDYFTPQLYWQIDSAGQSYPKLLAWWAEQSVKQRHLWPGIFTSRVRSGPEIATSRNVWGADEIIRQIELTRAQPGASGNVHFSMKALMDNRDGLADKLKRTVYSEPALVPESDWLGRKAPGEPSISVRRSAQGASIALSVSGERPWLWVVRTLVGNRWHVDIVPGAEDRYLVEPDDAGAPIVEVVVSPVSRLGQEGPATRHAIEGRN